jgi:serine/threonine protein kinase
VFFAWYGGVAVAVKKLYFKHMSDDELAEFAKEAQVLSKLNHPNVIKLVGTYPNFYLHLSSFSSFE